MTSTANPTAWWKLKFSKTHYISRIRLFNRQDKLRDRIEGVRVHVDNTLVGIAANRESVEPNIFENIDMFGNEVMINGSSSNLQICEVEVYGAKNEGTVNK